MSNPKPSRRSITQMADLEPELFDALENGLTVFKQARAALCQPDRRPAAVKQDRPELFLKLFDLSAQGRLRDVQPLGRAAKMLFLRDRYEIFQLFEVHVIFFRGVTGARFGAATCP
jgi:hypothetical protein